MECIILAGGLGTRLRSVIGAQPKCMAEVAGRPFLFYLLDMLVAQGFERVILSLGYLHEQIINHPELQSYPLIIDWVVEEAPLGTGGGIRLAMGRATSSSVFIINGDTMFRVNLPEMLSFHKERQAAVTLALKPMQHFDRYGVVTLDDRQFVEGFHEKSYREQGLINGGVYIVEREPFLQRTSEGVFSFEKDYLEPAVADTQIAGYCSDTYFIDIGIPSDFEKAQQDFAQ